MQGGLGIVKIEFLNKAMLANQFWRIIFDPNKLVSKVIIQKYGKGFIDHISEGNNNVS